ILREVERIREEPLTADELTLSKDSLVRSLPAQFESSGSVSSSTAELYVYDLGLDYYAKINARISAVTAEQAQAAARRYLNPGQMIVVVVGDAGQIREPLQALNLGPLEVWTPDGRRAE